LRKRGTIVVNRVTASPAANRSLGNAELPNPLRRADLMAMPISVPTYTVDDLDRFPDDGNRYELLDGVLLVTPSPGMPHQVATTRLAALLSNLLEPRPEILVASPGVIILPPKTQLEPVILVFRAPTGSHRW
jgi:Uma2 family endonuclease